MKILPKLSNTAQQTCLKTGKSIQRYILKDTINGRYERNMDGFTLFGAATFFHALFLTSRSVENIGISAALATCCYGNAVAAIKNRIKLKPIKKKAKAIKKAAKLAKKNAKRLAQEQTQTPTHTFIKKTLNKQKVLFQSIKNKLLRNDKK